jgi:hypothetical protein
MRKLFYLILITNSLNMFGIEKNLVHQDDFAKELSSYSFFTDQHAQIPSKRVFSYSLASSLFSDYTKKQRWVYVPEGYVASYKENEIYDFPDGSALIKTFYYDDDSINKKNLLETRLLIKNNGSWKAASYAWNEIEYFINNKIFKAHTLNEKLAVDWTDLSMSLDDRARSYLDINCGHCHIETGAANSTGLYLDLNEQRKNHLGIYKKPVATGRGSGGFKYSIVPGMPSQSILIHRMKSLDPGIMMPESGRALADKEAIEMLEEWIASL